MISIYHQLIKFNTKTKGKGTSDPLKSLPQLPEKRTKQTWVAVPAPVVFPGQPKLNEIGQESHDLIKELYASNLHLLSLSIEFIFW